VGNPALPSASPPETGPTLTPRGGVRYQRRRPDQGSLYQVVRDNLETFYAAVEEGFVSAPLPSFVRDELEGFLDCGLLCRGAALLVCPECRLIETVALSCKGRGFCPSCLGRRMAETSANLVEAVLPPGVPLRQWVVTFPFELRPRLSFDAELLSAVCGLVNEVLLGFYERTLRQHAGTWEGEGRRKLQSGTVMVVQRVNSDFRLNPHLHVLCLDGAFAEEPEGPPTFLQLPSLSTAEVAEILVTLRVRLLRLLERRGVIERDARGRGFTLLPSEAADPDPVLAQLSVAAVSGALPAGPERRQRPPLHRVPDAEPRVLGALCASDSGLSLHAATVAKRDDDAGKEALCRYVLRPPLAQGRVKLLADGMVRIVLKRPFGDGTTAVDIDPLSLLCRLATSVPAPMFNTVRYGGILAPAAKWRSAVVPPAPPEQTGSAARSAEPTSDHEHGSLDGTAPRRSRYRPWRELLMRTFAIDLRCKGCGRPMQLKAFLTSARSLERLCRKLGDPTAPPERAPARGPPYFASKIVRRSLGERFGQQELFEGA
jgi:hypothetical protein